MLRLTKKVNKMMTKKNMMGLITVVFMVLICAVPAFAEDQTTQTAKVTVDPTVAIESYFAGVKNGQIDLGTVKADGLRSTPVSGELRTLSNVNIDLKTYVSGNFEGGSPADTISFSNFRWGAGATPTTDYTTTAATVLTNWAKAPKGSYNSQAISFDIFAPVGTNPGDYTTTVYFTAIQHT